jgi:hypothetical protein
MSRVAVCRERRLIRALARQRQRLDKRPDIKTQDCQSEPSVRGLASAIGRQHHLHELVLGRVHARHDGPVRRRDGGARQGASVRYPKTALIGAPHP